jgi:hypothetical protein
MQGEGNIELKEAHGNSNLIDMITHTLALQRTAQMHLCNAAMCQRNFSWEPMDFDAMPALLPYQE